ncbi:MAG: MopE-related protein [Myxococcota bacterium]
MLALLACDEASTLDDLDGDGFDAPEDCDDHDASVNPDATEVWYDFTDQDCDGNDRDQDGDGYAVQDDCDDAVGTTYPGADDAWYDGVDANCDDADDFDQDADGYDVDVDCDDTDVSRHPDAEDVWYDGEDTNCDGADDFDQDGDGFTVDGDCDDTDAAVNPDAQEVWYDGVDQDCDGADDYDQDADGYELTDDCDDTVATTHPGAGDDWYDGVDANCDGADDYDQDADGYELTDDCDDTVATTHPGAGDDWYDGVDANCDGADDYDQDADGYELTDDCDDIAATTHPGAGDDWYDGVDANCDGADDYDQDADGYELTDDCDDTVSTTHPGAGDEWYDGVDANCDGADDYDQDADGYELTDDCDDADAAVNPSATEICENGIDDDCDGSTNACVAEGMVVVTSDYDVHFAGESRGDYAGLDVLLHDMNGDGLADALIDAYKDDDGANDAGAIAILLAPSAAEVNLADADAKLTGTEEDDWLPGAYAAGDVDGDGEQDLVVTGGSHPAFLTSYVYVIAGPHSGVAGTDSAALQLAGESYSDGFADGVFATDWDMDGVTDILVGVSGYDSPASGSGALFGYQWLPARSFAYADADYAVTGSATGHSVGWDFASCDLDGDGIQDFITSSYSDDTTATDAGAVYALAGPPSGVVDVSTADLALLGEESSDFFGGVLACADFDADGLADIAAGGPVVGRGVYETGAVYMTLSPRSGTVNVSTADWVVRGDDWADEAGRDVAAGDFDGDGAADLAVTAWYADLNGTNSGGAFLFRGPWSGEVTTADADLALVGEAGELVGTSVAAGDADGDSLDDLLVGVGLYSNTGDAFLRYSPGW